jgi:hypothetical protein
LLALAAFAMLAGPAFAQVVPVGDLLFQDTYNYTEVSLDLNVDINSPSRVAGPLAGQVSYDMDNMVGLKDIDGPNLKLDLSQGGNPDLTARVGLTKDFNNDLALGGLTVIATVDSRGGFAGIGVGHSGSSASNIGDLYTNPGWDAVPGFYGNVFDGSIAGLSTTTFASNGVAQWFSNLNFAGGGYGDNYVELGLVFTDAGDNNPFNGSGTITAKMYVNGNLITTAEGPDFAHNYLSYQTATSQYTSFQNLRVYGNAAAVPEPGVLTLLAAAAGFAFVCFRRRR